MADFLEALNASLFNMRLLEPLFQDLANSVAEMGDDTVYSVERDGMS